MLKAMYVCRNIHCQKYFKHGVGCTVKKMCVERYYIRRYTLHSESHVLYTVKASQQTLIIYHTRHMSHTDIFFCITGHGKSRIYQYYLYHRAWRE